MYSSSILLNTINFNLEKEAFYLIINLNISATQNKMIYTINLQINLVIKQVISGYHKIGDGLKDYFNNDSGAVKKK